MKQKTRHDETGFLSAKRVAIILRGFAKNSKEKPAGIP